MLTSHPSLIVRIISNAPPKNTMREEEDHKNWFSRWEEELPTPEELTPLSQSLITPDLALAFDIALTTTSNPSPPPPPSSAQLPQSQNPTHHHPPNPPTQPNSSSDFVDSPELTSIAGPGGGPDEPARTLKRPRLVWTPQLHKRFVDAVAHLGIKNAVPKTIMQLMSVDGLTRENVASHLQKYRLYLKRMQGIPGSGGAAAGPVSAADAAADHLFASAPVPHHFLRAPGGPPPPPGDHFLPYVPVAALQHHHHQMAAAAAAVAAAQQQPQYQHQRHMGHFGSPPPSGQFEHGFLARQQAVHRMVGGPTPPPPPYVEDLDSAASGEGSGRRVLTLFPTGED